MIVQQLTETEADARIRELEYLAKGLENKAKSLMSDVTQPEVFRRLQDERRASIARWQKIVDDADEQFKIGAERATLYAQRARQLRMDAAVLKRRQKIEELLSLGAALHEAESLLGDSASLLHVLADKGVQKLIAANAE